MTERLTDSRHLSDLIASYRSSAETNDHIWNLFTQRTNSIPLLSQHRDWFETRRFGFGDRAFHYLWLLLVESVATSFEGPLEMLEIGVFKGQTLSLWALIAREIGRDCVISGISPLKGKPPTSRWLHRAKMLLDSGYREDAHVGNLHHDSNFREDIETAFAAFSLDIGKVSLLEGFSQDPRIVSKISGRSFHVLYVDGGHRYEEVSADLRLYGPLVVDGGYMIVDDAAFFEPGSVFFKGFESVSRAVDELDPSQFQNVLNVGHNRVFRKLAKSEPTP